MAETNDNNLGQMSILSEPELKAIEMKFEGYNMKEIAEEIKEKYHCVRTWFMRGGKLHDFYRAYAEQETKLRRAEADHTFKAHLNNAVRTLVAVMNKSKLDVARVQAAKEIINRQLGEPLKVVANADEEKVNDYLEAARLILDEKIQGNDGRGKDGDDSQSSQ